MLVVAAPLWLAVQLRSQPSFEFTFFSTLCLVLSVGLWFTSIQPVNIEWAKLASVASTSLIEAYGRLRSGWQYGHPLAFALWFGGVSVLGCSVLGKPSLTRRWTSFTQS